MKCWWRFGHDYGPWEVWGITYQRRRCRKCGLYRTKDQ